MEARQTREESPPSPLPSCPTNDENTESSSSSSSSIEMGKLPPIGVFWDIENCHVPKGKSALHFVSKIRNQFFVGHTEAEFMCVCDTKKEFPDTIQELQDAQVTIAHINAISKNAADEKLKQHMRRFAAVHSHPASILLISGDVNFAPDLSDLRHRHNFQVILIHPNHVPAALLACANEHYSLDEFALDVLPRSTNKPLDGSNEVLVSHLPLGEFGAIRRRLSHLSANCGGKVLDIFEDQASIRFPNAESAIRAKKRMEGADVLGNKIKVNVKESSSPRSPRQKKFKGPFSENSKPFLPVKQHQDGIRPSFNKSFSNESNDGFRGRRQDRRNKRLNKPDQPWMENSELDTSEQLSSKQPKFKKGKMATKPFSRGEYPLEQAGNFSKMNGPSTKRKHCMNDIKMPGMNSVTFGSLDDGNISNVAQSFLDGSPDHMKRGGSDVGKESPEMPEEEDLENCGVGIRNRPRGGRGILHLPHGQLYQHQDPVLEERSRSSSRNSEIEAELEPIGMMAGRGYGLFRKTPGACRPGTPGRMPSPQQAPTNPFRGMASPAPSSYSSGSAWDEEDGGFGGAPVQLLVSNLDYNISAREWKKILSAEFSQHVQVISVHIQTQPDNTNVAYVRVPTTDEGRFAISQFHRKKIGYKRIHVSLLSGESAASQANAKYEVRAVLREVTGNALPLFKFIELFEKRYHRNISVSELYRMKDTVQITEQGGTGRQVSLIFTPPSPSEADDISEPDIVMEPCDKLESPVCQVHCEEGSKMYIDALDSNDLPFVQIQLRTLAPQVHALLQSHEGNMPLMSFPACYAAESGKLEITSEGGVPLEHLISCVPGVKVALCHSGIKKVQWADSKPPPTLEFGRMCASPHMTQQLSQFSREVIDLLKNSPQCRMPFSKFIPSYHHHFGRQCRVADYGYTKLFELFEAIPHVVQIIGSGSRRFVTLSHRAQVKRFSSDLMRILKSQASKQINVMDFPIVYYKIIGKGFDIADYGVCYIEDMLSEIPDTTVVVSGVGKDMIMAIPRREQTREEMERMKQFALEVVDLLRHSPRCRMPFSKFIPSYHHHFGKQCRVANYGFTKLIELFEAIPHVVKIIEEHDEKMLCLTRVELLIVLEDQVNALLQSSPDLELPVPEFLTAFMRFHGHSIHLQDYEVSSVTELISKIPNVANVENRSGRLVIVLVDHSKVRQLAERVLAILMDQVDSRMTIGQLANQFEIRYQETLDVNSLVADLQGVVQVSDNKESSVVKLCPLQQFARDVRNLLSSLGGKILLSQFEEAYAQHFGINLVPASYGQPSVLALLQAIPNMVMVRGKGFHRTVLLLQNLKGEMIFHEEFERESPADFSSLDGLPAEDSGIQSSSNDYFNDDDDDSDLMKFASGTVSPYRDLMSGSIPSSIPSPELCPMETHRDLINFTPSPMPGYNPSLDTIFRTPDFLNSTEEPMSATCSNLQPRAQYQASGVTFVEEPVSNLAAEFAESRFMMSYKNTSPVSWGDMNAQDLVAMSSLNAEAPAWCQYQYCDWGARQQAGPPAPPLSELLKRAQHVAGVNAAWQHNQQLVKEERNMSVQAREQMREGGPAVRALSPLQHASEQLKQQLLHANTDNANDLPNAQVGDRGDGGKFSVAESVMRETSVLGSPPKSLAESSPVPGSPAVGSCRRSRLAARFSVSPNSPNVSGNQ